MAAWYSGLTGGAMSVDALRREIRAGLKFRTPEQMRGEIAGNLAHLTSKAAALLSAQAIFIVVETWGLEHGWPRIPTMISVLALVVAVLLLLTLLRSVYMPYSASDDANEFEFDAIFVVGHLLTQRAVRFNIALFLTFGSVILLGFGAIETAWA